MFAADLPSSSSSYSSSVEAEKKVTANLLVQYLFVCCFVSFGTFWWVKVFGFLLQRGFLLLLLRFVCSRKGVRFLVCFHVGHFLFLFLFLVVCIEETESMTSAEQLVLELIVPEQRENALLDLSKVRLLFCTPVCVWVCLCVCLCIFFFSSFSLQLCAKDFHFCTN
jgi:hypothetical protein